MIGPATNAIIVVLVGGYFWRLWTHKGDEPDPKESASENER